MPAELTARGETRMGLSDERVGEAAGACRWARLARQRCASCARSTNVRPVYKRVDTCAAEFESYTPYLYSTYEEEDEAAPTDEEESHHPGQRAEPHRAGN